MTTHEAYVYFFCFSHLGARVPADTLIRSDQHQPRGLEVAAAGIHLPDELREIAPAARRPAQVLAGILGHAEVQPDESGPHPRNSSPTNESDLWKLNSPW